MRCYAGNVPVPLTGCCFQATPPAAPPPSQPPQQQPAEPEGEEDGEERFQARVVGCKRANGVLAWLTDYGVESEDRFHHEPMEYFEGGGLKLLHDFHAEVRVEQAMDKKVCPPASRRSHCCLCCRHRTTTPICARLRASLRTRVSRVR